MLGISYREHKTNEYVWQQVDILAKRKELLVSTVKRCKLSWFGHVCRYDMLPKIILQETVDRRRVRPRKSWKGNIKGWTGQSISSLLPIADDRRSRWAVIAADASVGVPPTTLGHHARVLVICWLTMEVPCVHGAPQSSKHCALSRGPNLICPAVFACAPCVHHSTSNQK